MELVKFWSALGYLIVYASARPNVMKQVVRSWLDAHGFPASLCLFVEGLSTPEKNMSKKYTMLKQLSETMNLHFFAAYGSHKDLAMYSNLRVSADSIFIFPDRIVSSRSKNAPNSSLPCVTIPKSGISKHLNDLRLQSEELMAKFPLQFAIQSTRRSPDPRMNNSGTAYVYFDAESAGSSSKSPKVKTKKLRDTLKRESTADFRQSKAVDKQHTSKADHPPVENRSSRSTGSL